MQGCEWQVLVISNFCAPAALADPSCLLRPDPAVQGSVQPQLHLWRGLNFLAEQRLNIFPFLQSASLNRVAVEYMFY